MAAIGTDVDMLLRRGPSTTAEPHARREIRHLGLGSGRVRSGDLPSCSASEQWQMMASAHLADRRSRSNEARHFLGFFSVLRSVIVAVGVDVVW